MTSLPQGLGKGTLQLEISAPSYHTSASEGCQNEARYLTTLETVMLSRHANQEVASSNPTGFFSISFFHSLILLVKSLLSYYVPQGGGCTFTQDCNFLGSVAVNFSKQHFKDAALDISIVRKLVAPKFEPGVAG